MSKSEAMSFNTKPDLDYIGPLGKRIKLTNTMKILGLIFDNRLSWEAQVNQAVNKAKRILSGLKAIRGFLTDVEFKRVLTSHFYPVLLYASEVWFPCSGYKSRARVTSVHYCALRVMVHDRFNNISRYKLNTMAERATPSEWASFATAKLGVRVIQASQPLRLALSLTTNSYEKNRSPGRLFFFSDSRKRIGDQSLRNRLGPVMNDLCFPWINSSPDALRINLKKHFFAYFK